MDNNKLEQIKVLLTRLRNGIDWLKQNEASSNYEKGLERYADIRRGLESLGVSQDLIDDIEKEYLLTGKISAIYDKDMKLIKRYSTESKVKKSA